MFKMIRPVLLAVAIIGCTQPFLLASENEYKDSQQQAPDNSKKNKRDVVAHKTTAEKQPNDKADVNLIANIRKAILAQKGISVDAQNVKIISKRGVVTLRGPVESEEEKDLIGKLAKDNGANTVTNQLEAKKQ